MSGRIRCKLTRRIINSMYAECIYSFPFGRYWKIGVTRQHLQQCLIPLKPQKKEA